jgi:hypothetical protein
MAKQYDWGNWDTGETAYTPEEWDAIRHPEIPVKKTQNGYQVQPEAPKKDMSNNDYFDDIKLEAPKKMWKPDRPDTLSDALAERAARRIGEGIGRNTKTRRAPKELKKVKKIGKASTKQVTQPKTTPTIPSNRNRRGTTTRNVPKLNPTNANKPSTVATPTTDYSNYYGSNEEDYMKFYKSGMSREDVIKANQKVANDRSTREKTYKEHNLPYKKGDTYYNLPKNVSFKDWANYERYLNEKNTMFSPHRKAQLEIWKKEIEKKYDLKKLNDFKNAIVAARRRSLPK